MDPMQRMLLERTFEALADAGKYHVHKRYTPIKPRFNQSPGINPLSLRGRKIGVFVASGIGENDNLFYESIVSGFGVTGHSRAMMANRISYWLDLKGIRS